MSFAETTQPATAHEYPELNRVYSAFRQKLAYKELGPEYPASGLACWRVVANLTNLSNFF